MRFPSFVAALILASAWTTVALPAPLSAQSDRSLDPRVPPAITWCEKPARKTRWKRQPVSFLLEFAGRDSSDAQRILAPYLPYLLAAISERFAAEHQPTRDLTAAKAGALPPGEPRYKPADLLSPNILFDLKGNGQVDSIVVTDTTGSLLASDLRAALLAAAARGDVFGPYADSTVRTRLDLTVGLGEWTGSANFPAFTLYAPLDRPPRADPGNNVGGYPPDALGWEGKLLFQFSVDENGRAVPGTAKVLGAENVVWKSDRYRMAFENFKRQVETSLPRMRFTPAESLGCTVSSWVQQEFVFTMKSGPAIP